MVRVKGNCSRDTDFLAQSQIIKKRFAQKGYNEQQLDRTIQEVLDIARSEYLQDKRNEGESNSKQWGFISNFHAQYRKVEALYKHH